MTNEEKKQEHVLVCMSFAPSNARIIQSASDMARAFGASFTAIYVKTPVNEQLKASDKEMLQKNIGLAESLGADIVTVLGEDIPSVISEFVRISKVTRVVVGQGNARRRSLYSPPTLTEKLLENSPDVEIHIIPDSGKKSFHIEKKMFRSALPSPLDVLTTFFLLAIESCLGIAFSLLGFTDANIITVYIIGSILAAIITKNQLCSALSSLFGVLLFDFLFTDPLFTLLTVDRGYMATFTIMLMASLFAGGLSSRLQAHAKESAKSAYRAKVLLEANSLMQKAETEEEALDIAANRLVLLFSADTAIYASDGKIRSFCRNGSEFSVNEALCERALSENKCIGAGCEIAADDGCIYLPVKIGGVSLGVIVIRMGEKKLEPFDNNMILSLIGECVLTVEGIRNARAREEAALLMKNEQLRSNLLRAISHDLRTPLTSISGNVENLMKNHDMIDVEERRRLLSDTYDDSNYLIGLVENLLSITRIGDGRMKLDMSPELIEELLSEAKTRMEKRSDRHEIIVDAPDELLLCDMDARLITQVIINLIDNAIKYTDGGSIILSARDCKDEVAVSVSDEGNGIRDEIRDRIFDMFFTDKAVADGRRSMGLGLALCRSIVEAHGGTISVSDNSPHGSVFTFTLKKSKVKLNAETADLGR